MSQTPTSKVAPSTPEQNQREEAAKAMVALAEGSSSLPTQGSVKKVTLPPVPTFTPSFQPRSAPAVATTDNDSQPSIAETKLAYAYRYIDSVTARLDAEGGVAFQKTLCAYFRKEITEVAVFTKLYGLLYAKNVPSLFDGFMLFLPQSWRSTDLNWLKAAVRQHLRSSGLVSPAQTSPVQMVLPGPQMSANSAAHFHLPGPGFARPHSSLPSHNPLANLDSRGVPTFKPMNLKQMVKDNPPPTKAQLEAFAASLRTRASRGNVSTPTYPKATPRVKRNVDTHSTASPAPPLPSSRLPAQSPGTPTPASRPATASASRFTRRSGAAYMALNLSGRHFRVAYPSSSRPPTSPPPAQGNSRKRPFSALAAEHAGAAAAEGGEGGSAGPQGPTAVSFFEDIENGRTAEDARVRAAVLAHNQRENERRVALASATEALGAMSAADGEESRGEGAPAQGGGSGGGATGEGEVEEVDVEDEGAVRAVALGLRARKSK